jgi:hypothetical protein
MKYTEPTAVRPVIPPEYVSMSHSDTQKVWSDIVELPLTDEMTTIERDESPSSTSERNSQ